MNLVLDIATSAEFWRQVYPVTRAPKNACFAVPNECACLKKDVIALLPDWVTPELLERTGGVVHALSLNDERRHSNRHVVHAWRGPIPNASFYDLGNKVLVETPAFMFLSAAPILSSVQLIAFGYELCGTYSFDEREERGFRKRKEPLLTVAQLKRYLERAEACHGHAKALAAASHIIDRSASPMETFDAMCMTLPYRLGGYGLPKPQMNYPVSLTARASRIALRNKCFLDMGYPDAHLDVEHHGRLDHENDEARASDRARVNALKEMDFEVVELTNDQVEDLLAFEYIVQRIAKSVGKRIRREDLGVTAQRVALHQELRAWNGSSGLIRHPRSAR